MNLKKTAIAAAVATTLGVATAPAQAQVLDFSWDGLFTLLDEVGVVQTNTSKPYYYDATWGYGKRTQITGTAQFNTATGGGSATVNNFEFFNGGAAVAHDITMQAVGDGMGGPGTLVIGNMLFDWNGNNNIPVEIVLDAAGMFGALGSGTLMPGDVITGGALPASDGVNKGKIPIGPAPMATTNFNSDGVSVGADDGIGGSPMTTAPFPGFNANFDITAMTFNGCVADCGPVIPVPAAVWLFGSGLLGLVGVARRRTKA